MTNIIKNMCKWGFLLFVSGHTRFTNLSIVCLLQPPSSSSFLTVPCLYTIDSINVPLMVRVFLVLLSYVISYLVTFILQLPLFFFIPNLTINRVSCNFLSTGISYISFLVMLAPSFFFISFIGHSCHLNHILVLQKTRFHIVHISFLILSSLAAQLLFLILRLRLGSIRIIPLLPTCSLFIMFVPDFFRTTLVGGSTLFV